MEFEEELNDTKKAIDCDVYRCSGDVVVGVYSARREAFYGIINMIEMLHNEIEQLKRGEKHECKCGACTKVQDDT